MIRAIAIVTLAVLMVMYVAWLIATGEQRIDPMSYSVGRQP